MDGEKKGKHQKNKWMIWGGFPTPIFGSTPIYQGETNHSTLEVQELRVPSQGYHHFPHEHSEASNFTGWVDRYEMEVFNNRRWRCATRTVGLEQRLGDRMSVGYLLTWPMAKL